MVWQKVSMYLPRVACMACGLGASLAYVYPHTYGLEKYKDIMTDRSEGSSQNTLAEVHLASQIKKHFKWQDGFRSSSVEFIQSKQLLDLSHRGSLNTVWGAVVSLPVLFTTNSVKTAQENPVDYLQRYNIKVNSNEGQTILDLFLLSPAAKKFVIARELCHANSAQLYFHFCGINFAFFSCFAFGHTLSKLIHFPGATVISYLTVVPLLGYFYIKTYDYYNCHVQAKSDKTAATIDQSVADGGVEYYSKLIARKQALEELWKQNGEEVYKQPINDAESKLKFNMSWRKPELSLEERKVRLIQASQKLYHSLGQE